MKGPRPPLVDPVKMTVSGAAPLLALAEALATRLGETTTVAVAAAVPALASVMVSVAV